MALVTKIFAFHETERFVRVWNVFCLIMTLTCLKNEDILIHTK